MDISDTRKELFDPYVPIYKKAAFERGGIRKFEESFTG